MTANGFRELSAVEAIASLLAQVQGRIAAEDQLRHLADHDDLTRVHNRRALVAHLGDRLKARRRGPVAVLFFDLDRLKAINDYLGHNAGDRFIRVFADRLRETVGDRSDRPARRRRVRRRSELPMTAEAAGSWPPNCSPRCERCPSTAKC